MPLDPLAKRFLTMMAAASPAVRSRPTPSERRASLAKLMQFVRTDAHDVIVSDGVMPGSTEDIRYRVYSPERNRDARLPGFVFFHGGGMVAGSIDTHDAIARALADAGGCRLISVDYRLAPEHPFPAAVEDAIAATDHVARNAAALGIDATRLVVGGDSAGGTLAALVCQHMLEHDPHAILAQCLICPVLDFEGVSPSREAFADDPLIGRATIEADLAYYLPRGIIVNDTRISPLRATQMKGLPTAIIHTAEFDPMRDEGNAYAAKLLAAGVIVEHICHDGMIHNFHALGAVLPQAKLVLSQIGEQLRRVLNAS